MPIFATAGPRDTVRLINPAEYGAERWSGLGYVESVCGPRLELARVRTTLETSRDVVVTVLRRDLLVEPMFATGAAA